MGMTLAEKILAAHCGKDVVKPGEFINPKLDFVIGNEGSSILCIKKFEEMGLDRVFDKDRIALFLDHTAPNKDVASAETNKHIREFCRKYDLTHFYEVGRMGISHVMVPERGLVGAGDLVVGGDSHTCTYGALGCLSTGIGSSDLLSAIVLGELWMKVPETIRIVYHGHPKPGISGKDLILYTIGQIGVEGARYKAIEFAGEAIADLSMEARFTMANMAVEAGAKCGLFTPDQKTVDYMEGRCVRPYKLYEPDADAVYEKVLEFDVSELTPQIAKPYLPGNVCPIEELSGDQRVYVDQVFIGSCTNARIEDLRIAAGILKGRKVNPRVRLIVVPGSQDVVKQALHEGLIATFLDAEAAVSTPTCGACVGTHMGILAAGEVCASTTNRNFVGRMGSKESKVYLVSPAVAAATAVLGYIGTEDEIKMD